jgi:hypothetical protein
MMLPSSLQMDQFFGRISLGVILVANTATAFFLTW